MLINTTDGIQVAAYDVLQISIDEGQWMDYATIRDKQDASFAIVKCRAGSVLQMDGRVFRFRIIRQHMGTTVVYERN